MMTHRDLTDAIAELGAVCVRSATVEIVKGEGMRTVKPALFARKCDHENCVHVLRTEEGPQRHEGPRWFILPEGAAELLAEDKLSGTVSDKWATLPGDPVLMPAWWSPERRKAWRDPVSGNVIPEASNVHFGPAWVRITADLETGEELAL